MDKEHETNFGWWTDKPVREDRGTSFAPLSTPRKAPDEPVWIKAAVILTIMFVFGISVLRLLHLIP
ncbi:hypothetical protein QTH91_07225 [Variovorax dokdonensis]|uniref:Uncharacterized protein n=1 Tax=Variovorax dokdonensis TaxID=344883 RepID=A0ABT7N8J7_9BURK|nr:hypothetical protein [Variovorax dokdonensis]MDM0044266.1 hypothetical protein [Variovorax dokdonensis]